MRWNGCLAEVSSCQLEYTYLGKASGVAEHYRAADRTWQTLKEADLSKLGGMLPTYYNLNNGQPTDTRLQVGAMADSGHEYLLKQYLMTSKTDTELLKMYLRTTTHMITRLLWITPERKILYPASSSGTPPNDVSNHVFEHLACFLPGLFALGAQTLPLDDLESLGVNFASLADGLSAEGQEEYRLLANYKLSDLHRWAAEGMSEACAVVYHDMPTGLSPDEVAMTGDSTRWIDALEQWRSEGSVGAAPGTSPVAPRRPASRNDRPRREYTSRRQGYELRPETVESLFLMWRLTRDERWRIHGWNIFQAIERETKTDSGYTSIHNVESSPAAGKNSMPSYFMAETLKYLYLLFADNEVVPLNGWVFNTEAHPLPVFAWTQDEKARFGIA